MKLSKLGFAVLAVAMSSPVFAAGSLDPLVNAISFVDVIAAIFSIGLLIISVDAAQIGWRKVRHMLKGA